MAKKKAETTGRPTPVARAKRAVAGAAGAVADALTAAAGAVGEHVVQPPAQALGLVKPKKAATKPAPAKGKSAAGKVMSKKVMSAPAAAGQSKGPGAARKSPAAAAGLRKKMTQPPRRGR